MDFVQVVNRLVEIIPAVRRVQIVRHLTFPGFLHHQPVQKTREEELPDNRLDGAAAYPQLTHRLLRHPEDGAGGDFRLENRRYRPHRPRELVPCPFKLRRIEPRHLHHRKLNPAVLMHQLGTYRVGKPADRRFGPAVGGLQGNGTVGQRGPYLDNHAPVARNHKLERRAGTVHVAEVRHLSHASKLVRRKGAKRRQHSPHGIVNPDINRAEAILNVVSRVHHRLTVGDVSLHSVCIYAEAAQLFLGGVQACLIAGDEADIVTCFCKAQRRGFSHARRPTGNHYDSHRTST